MSEVNIYSKEQTDAKFDEKADIADVYTKEQIDEKLIAKQDTLVSGTNIKTINGSSILGEGDFEITGVQLKNLVFSGAPESSTFLDSDIVIVNGLTSNSIVHQGLYVYNSGNSTLISIGPTEVGGNVTIDDVVAVSTITLFSGWVIRNVN